MKTLRRLVRAIQGTLILIEIARRGYRPTRWGSQDPWGAIASTLYDVPIEKVTMRMRWRARRAWLSR